MEAKETSVRALIKNLAPGEAVAFPISRLDYVLSCRTRLQTTEGKKFSSKTDTDAAVVTITREPEVTPDKPGTI